MNRSAEKAWASGKAAMTMLFCQLQERWNAKIEKPFSRHPFLCAAWASLAVALLPHGDDGLPVAPRFWFWTLLLGMALVVGAALWHALRGRLSLRRLLFYVTAAAFLLRALYVLATPYWMRQHDSYGANDMGGHLYYIQLLLDGGWSLRGVDPLSEWQLYHPPLHHYLEAFWLCVCRALGAARQGFGFWELTQIPTLFYATASTLLSYRILCLLGVRGKALAACYTAVAFHPVFLLLAGSINNDSLCTLLVLASVFLALRWYQMPSSGRIGLLALSVGLAGLAKASGLLVSAGVAFLFCAKLWNVLRRRPCRPGGLLAQYGMFGVVCVPLGLCWALRCKLLYEMPLTFVPDLGPESDQLISGYSLWERLLAWVPAWWRYPYPSFLSAESYSIPLQLLKTSLFDESSYTDVVPVVLACALLFSGAALAVFALAGAACSFARRCPPRRRMLRLSCAVTALVFLAMTVKFCFSYPYICTENFRYLAPAFPLTMALFGVFLTTPRELPQSAKKETQMRFQRWRAELLQTAGISLCLVFSLCSALLYLRVCGQALCR